MLTYMRTWMRSIPWGSVVQCVKCAHCFHDAPFPSSLAKCGHRLCNACRKINGKTESQLCRPIRKRGLSSLNMQAVNSKNLHQSTKIPVPPKISAKTSIHPKATESSVKPSSVKPSVQPAGSKSSVKPSSAKPFVQPPGSKSSVKPSSAKPFVQPPGSKSSVKPGSAKPFVQPPGSMSSVKPGSAKPFVQPSGSKLAVKRSSSANPSVQPRPSKQCKPSTAVTLNQSDAVKTHIPSTAPKPSAKPNISKLLVKPGPSMPTIQPRASRLQQLSIPKPSIQDKLTKIPRQPPGMAFGRVPVVDSRMKTALLVGGQATVPEPRQTAAVPACAVSGSGLFAPGTPKKEPPGASSDNLGRETSELAAEATCPSSTPQPHDEEGSTAELATGAVGASSDYPKPAVHEHADGRRRLVAVIPPVHRIPSLDDSASSTSSCDVTLSLHSSLYTERQVDNFIRTGWWHGSPHPQPAEGASSRELLRHVDMVADRIRGCLEYTIQGTIAGRRVTQKPAWVTKVEKDL